MYKYEVVLNDKTVLYGNDTFNNDDTLLLYNNKDFIEYEIGKDKILYIKMNRERDDG